MWIGSGDAAEVMLEDCAGVLVGGDWGAESNVAEILEGIGEFVVSWVVGLPVTVALGEFFGAEGGEP